MKTQLCTITALVSTGMMAGIFFTWTNAVTPGIGKLDDLSYLAALKSMNRVILNPLFLLLFFLPVCMIPLTFFSRYTEVSRLSCILLAAAALLYIIGCFGVTIFGNVPLNVRLEQAVLSSSANLNAEYLGQLRNGIEMQWNTFNLIRTCSSAAAFLFLVVTVTFTVAVNE